METILRALAVYLVLLLTFRLAGKRTLSQTTTFELVLLLIISETIQQAMVGDDHSIINGVILILTLIGADILLSWLKHRSDWLDRLVDDRPLVLVKDGEPLRHRMTKERVSEADVLAAARENHGLRGLDEIAFAVLEVDGKISVIPARGK